MIQYLCGMTDKEYRHFQRERQMEGIGKPVFRWLREIGNRFKDRGIFPPSLCDYYTAREDKETAAVVELLIPNTPKRISYTIELHKILGNSPWKMVRDRDFIYLGLPQNDRSILKNMHITASLIFNVLDWIWKCAVDLNIPLEHIMKGEKGIVRPAHMYPLREIIDNREMDYRVDMLMAKMCMPDGYGEGLWNIKEDSLSYPFSKETKTFLSAFFSIRGDKEQEALKRAIRLLDVPVLDMLYIEWGYMHLRRKYPEDTERMERRYREKFKYATSYQQSSAVSRIIPKLEM